MNRPFALPAESCEIVLDLPFPVSSNRLWRSARGRVFRSKNYLAWIKQADAMLMLNKQRPKTTLNQWFTVEILLHGRASDGDNRIKAVLDYLQNREIVVNDKLCHKGCWEWVSADRAPYGCRIIVRSWHGDHK